MSTVQLSTRILLHTFKQFCMMSISGVARNFFQRGTPLNGKWGLARWMLLHFVLHPMVYRNFWRCMCPVYYYVATPLSVITKILYSVRLQQKKSLLISHSNGIPFLQKYNWNRIEKHCSSQQRFINENAENVQKAPLLCFYGSNICAVVGKKWGFTHVMHT